MLLYKFFISRKNLLVLFEEEVGVVVDDADVCECVGCQDSDDGVVGVKTGPFTVFDFYVIIGLANIIFFIQV